MVLLGALLAVDRLRGEVTHAVDRDQIVAIEVGKPLQPLAALQLGEQRLVERAQEARIQLIETLAKARVARVVSSRQSCSNCSSDGYFSPNTASPDIR